MLHLFNVICSAKVAKLLQGELDNGNQHCWFSVPGAALGAGHCWGGLSSPVLIPQCSLLLQPRGNLVVTINHCQSLHVHSSLSLERSKSEFGSALKSQLGFVQHFGWATGPRARKFYPINNWSEEEFESRRVLPWSWSQTLPWEANTTLRLLLQLKFPSLDPFHTYVIKLWMGGSSSLLEKMHGGLCGGGVCITCSGSDFFHFSVNKQMLNSAFRSPCTSEWQVVDERRLKLWVGSPLAVLLQEAIQKFASFWDCLGKK